MVLFPPLAGWAHDTAGTATAAVVVGGLTRLLTAVALGGFRALQRRWPPEPGATGG